MARYKRKRQGLAAAWRRKARKKRGSLVKRTVKQNYRDIKKLKHRPELKFTGSTICDVSSNFCGQLLLNQKVNSWGNINDSNDWAVYPAGIPAKLWTPLIMRPMRIQQAALTTGTGKVIPAGENKRIGNEVQLYSLTFKITGVGSNARYNRGRFADVVQRQEIEAYIVLDREPCQENPTLYTTSATGIPTWEPEYIPCSLYPKQFQNEINNTFSGGNVNQQVLPYFATLRSMTTTAMGTQTNPSDPPGLQTGQLGTKSQHPLSFYSKDYVGETNRFKVLKRVKLSFNQEANPSVGGSGQAESFTSLQGKTYASKTVTIKTKYKLRWDTGKSVMPANQEILVFFCSNVVSRPALNNVPPSDYVAAPTVTCVSRCSFRDM